MSAWGIASYATGPDTGYALALGACLASSPSIGNFHYTVLAPATNAGITTLVLPGAWGDLKAFEIAHPRKSLKDKKVLVHSCLEGPKVDLIYRGTIVLKDGTAKVNIDKESNMSTGTFTALTKNAQIFLQNQSGFDRVRGKLDKADLSIECECKYNSVDEISWMVIAERNDPTIKRDPRTDKNGSLITEFPITKDVKIENNVIKNPKNINFRKLPNDNIFYEMPKGK
jgi:hypothetical protein